VSVDGATAKVGQQEDESEGDDLAAHLNSLEFGIDEDETPRVAGAGQNDSQVPDESPLFDPFTADDGPVDDDLEAHLESLHFDAGPATEDADSHGAVESATGGPADDDDFVETKLDLAMAYLDMNDPVGARSLLEEVVDEGTDAQKRRAEELLRGVAA
jgi:pilus assembly protein FimV